MRQAVFARALAVGLLSLAPFSLGFAQAASPPTPAAVGLATAGTTSGTNTSAFAAASLAAQKAIQAAFALDDSAAIASALVSSAAKLGAPADRKAVLVALAGFEERTGLPALAAKHFSEAASAETGKRDYNLTLDAARCALSSGDVDQAQSLARAVLLSCFDDAILIRARAYSAWIQLASGDRAGAFELFRSYAVLPAFAEWAPAFLFTLWWADSDEAAKSKLTKLWPVSPEAAVVRGEIAIAPAPFWYLMSRPDSLVADFAQAGQSSVATSTGGRVAPQLSGDAASKAEDRLSALKPSDAPREGVSAGAQTSPLSSADGSASVSITTSTAPVSGVAAISGQLWQQVGFFKNADYADELVARLRKLGFSPIVRSEKRASGTVYFAVLVPESADRTVAARLKDAGYESYLVTD